MNAQFKLLKFQSFSQSNGFVALYLHQLLLSKTV